MIRSNAMSLEKLHPTELNSIPTPDIYRSIRLVTLRLAGATTIEEANVVLKDFLVRFNTRRVSGSCLPPADTCLDSVLCFRHSRKVARDNTVKYRWRPCSYCQAFDPATPERWSWKDWTVSWLCGTRERSSPARRRRPVWHTQDSTARSHFPARPQRQARRWECYPGGTRRRTVDNWPVAVRRPPTPSRKHSASERCAEGEAQGPVDSNARELAIHRDTAKKYI